MVPAVKSENLAAGGGGVHERHEKARKDWLVPKLPLCTRGVGGKNLDTRKGNRGRREIRKGWTTDGGGLHRLHGLTEEFGASAKIRVIRGFLNRRKQRKRRFRLLRVLCFVLFKMSVEGEVRGLKASQPCGSALGGPFVLFRVFRGPPHSPHALPWWEFD
jgi:hypothetical protein